MTLLTLRINCTDCQALDDPAGRVQMVLFTGTAEGPCFKGRILPGGVDVQEYTPDGRGMLHARYMLEGVDREGQSCRVFIDNSAKVPGEETSPVIRTDSEALRRELAGRLVGRIRTDEEGLVIRIDREN